MIIRRTHVAFALVLGSTALGLAACGGSMAPEAPQTPALMPSTPDATLVEIARAERDLQAALGLPAAAPGGGYGQAQVGGFAQPPAPAPPPPPPQPAAEAAPVAPSAAPPTDRGAPSPEPQKAAPAATPCVTACRALASMTRATEHLCGLTGDADARCQGARGRVKSASDRVRAECPECSG